jgi:peptidoglycan/LPS O-acetylase OafA/YrhL
MCPTIGSQMSENHTKDSPRLAVINGLRGVAVILVLGFHFEVPLFDRGYWGVDLFFWISGFLITGGFLREYALNRELNKKFGWIDIRYYFLKRVRRLLPLSLLVLSFVVSAVYIFGDSDAVSQTLRRIPRIISFTFNMQLQSDSQDYFLKSFQDFGLLHYWSLSVEEQIYILSPFIFLFAVSFHGLKFFGYRSQWYQRVLALNVILSITSFYFMLKQNETNLVVNYYSTISRFWEFGLGSVVAVLLHIGIGKRISNQVRVYLMQVSSLAIVFSFVLLKNEGFGPLVLIPLAFTSIFVLLSVIGGNRDYLSKFLNLKLIQFFGDIAFPLYLIHWPAMVLLRSFPNQSNLINIFIYLSAITLVAYVLHKYVEAPILRIDISRFRSEPVQTSTRNRARLARRSQRVAAITVFSLVTTIAVLSYPKESEQKFSSFYSFVQENRYGTLSEQDLPAEEDSAIQSSRELPKVSLSPKPGAEPAPVETLSDLELPSDSTVWPTPTLRNEKEQIDSRWLAALQLANKTSRIKKGYVAEQSALLADLRRSWSSGCLDSKSSDSACVLGAGDKEIVLLGDSFAFALQDSILKAMPKGWRLRILTKGSCLPWNVNQYNKNGTLKSDCSDHAIWVQEYVSKSRPEMIIASGADQWLTNSSYDLWMTGFRSAVKFYLANSDKVVIISSAPGSGDLKDCVGVDQSLRNCFGTTERISQFVRMQAQESESLGYRYVNLIRYLCIDSSCPALINDIPVYADGNHMSSDFSNNFGEVIKRLNLFD